VASLERGANPMIEATRPAPRAARDLDDSSTLTHNQLSTSTLAFHRLAGSWEDDYAA
jgi:hypothetical protein